MRKYIAWDSVKAYQTKITIVWAKNDCAAQQMAESQFGFVNVLSYIHAKDKL
jgi:hypothetical protein